MRVANRGRSFGVIGMRLEKGDEVISLSRLSHGDVAVEVRDSYLRAASAQRRLNGGDYDGREEQIRDKEAAAALSTPEAQAMAAEEQFVLTVTENGYGKRTSAYEYRTTSRGGQGIGNIETEGRNGLVVASFPVANEDQVVMMSNGGRLIRMPVHDIRIAGRNTQGVILFSTEEGEKVVSVAHLDAGADGEGADGEGGDDGDDAPEDGVTALESSEPGAA
jgi:DNA gyrase subunit A